MQDKIKIAILFMIFFGFSGLFLGLGLTADNYQFFLSLRIPKYLAIILAGIAIGLSSFSFQTITNNRILTPSIMGFDSLYLFTQALLFLSFGSLSTVILNQYLNFAISLTIMVGFSFLLFTLYFKKTKADLISLLLLGVIIGQIFSNLSSFFIMLMEPNEFATLQSKMFASFNNIKVELAYITAPVLILISGILYSLHRQLDVMWLDSDNAISLGIEVKKLRMGIFFLSAVMIAISTALIGPILFLGILVTNLTRELFVSYRHHVLFLGVSLISVITLLGGQWIVENVFDFSTPLSVVINFIGGLYFLHLLWKNRLV